MKVLLHICCAVCASFSIEKLRQEGCDLNGYFYNPNIQPEEEYLKRLKETEKLAERQKLPLIVGDYEVDKWRLWIKDLEDEPEGGRRCGRCFALRLEETLKKAKEKAFDAFTTTLTISPHKNSQAINEIGQKAGGNLFLARDFKKQDGFKRTQELARQHNIYRQHYCGCIYSLR